jgi:general stress protein 26
MAKRPKDLVDKSESNQRIYYFLKSHPIGVLATVDPNGDPHAAVMYFSVGRDFSVTFTTKRYTKKSGNLTHNNHAMLLAYDAPSQTTVQIDGFAKTLDPKEAHESFKNTLDKAMETSISGMPPISKLEAGPYVAYRLRPLEIRMAIYARPEPGNYDMFETVDFIA